MGIRSCILIWGDTMGTIGERLTYARKRNGYTQESLAEAIGVSRGVIFNIEKGKTEPQTIVINAICQALKINKAWLMLGTGSMVDENEASESEEILIELYDVARGLSENERLFILDTMKVLKKHLGKEKDD